MYIAIISLLNTNFLETAEPIEEYHTAGDSHGALAPVGSRSSFKHLTPYNNSVSVTVKTLPQSKLPQDVVILFSQDVGVSKPRSRTVARPRCLLGYSTFSNDDGRCHGSKP